MEFLVSHWHCILPVVGIAAAMFFLWGKDKRTSDDTTRDTTITPRNNQD
ncbi:MAG: hypothetical protein LBJ48_04125 [Coriobacteriales bacterium]|jgi:hypothetical protein|nr:hypothetical protein [Coriobacteriales bacterium]